MTEGDAWRPVPAELDLPASVYESRAGLTGATSAPASATSWEVTFLGSALEYFADVSQFQGVPLDRSYPYRTFSFRVCDGTYLDRISAQNWSTAQALMNDPSHPLTVVYPYVVYRPGTWETVATYLHSLFGDRFPDRVAPMIDAEPFGGQVTGNHSIELNLWADKLAAMCVGGQKSVIGYSYTSGFQELWPNFPPWLKRRTASYGTWDPGFYDWQYSGGTGTGGHPGWPHGAGPWSLCDMNVTQKPIEQIVTDLGFGSIVTAPTAGENARAVWAQPIPNSPAQDFLIDAKNHAASADSAAKGNGTKLDEVLAELDAQRGLLEEILAAVKAPGNGSALNYGSTVILSMPQIPPAP